MRWKLVICLLLSVTTAAVYWPVRHYAFIYYDDPQFITENKAVIAGLTVEGFRHAFTRPVVGNWHPVTALSQMLDCELYGVWPGGHHLTNVALHAANAILLFLLLTQMTGAMWRSAAVAALFALHPLRVESVAWISERKDLLCAFFGLLSLFAYARFAQCRIQHARPKNPWYGAALLLFVLGLMSKTMLVTWPFVMLLLDVWPLQRLATDRWRASGKIWRQQWALPTPIRLTKISNVERSEFTMLTIHYFASIREALKRSQQQLELPFAVTTVSELISHLAASDKHLATVLGDDRKVLVGTLETKRP